MPQIHPQILSTGRSKLKNTNKTIPIPSKTGTAIKSKSRSTAKTAVGKKVAMPKVPAKLKGKTIAPKTAKVLFCAFYFFKSALL